VHEHDHSYRHLFARPQLIEELVREFVPEPWVQGLAFSTLERVNATFIADTLKRSEGDMIWKLRRRDGTPVYVFLFIEFQSRSERFMAVRMMGYVAALYQDLISRGELIPDGQLPLVIPLVVYNGDRRWRAPLELSELIEPVEPAAEAYVPRLRYWVIDPGAYTPEDLERRTGLVALLFWAKSQGARALRQSRPRLLEYLADDFSLRRAVLAWLRAEMRLDPEAIPEILSLEEFSDMWEQTFKRWEQELKEEGRVLGRKEGEAELLLRQLERKFGPLDRHTRTRVSKADSKHLLAWGERFATAERLEEVFEG
jgi:predicted transposase/invertase (TIGR01784 family)